MIYTKDDNTSRMMLIDGNGGHYQSLVGRKNVARTTPQPYQLGLTTPFRVSPLIAATLEDVATGGSMEFNKTYRFQYCPENDIELGTGVSSTGLTTANDGNNTHVVRVTLAQCQYATAYHIFCSRGVNDVGTFGKYLAKITEAQRAAGCTITAMGTVDATSPGAGKIDVRVPGTGLIDLQNGPFGIGASRGPTFIDESPVIDCTGYNRLGLYYIYHSDDFGAGNAVPTAGIYALAGEKYVNITTSSISLAVEGINQYSLVTINGYSSVKVVFNTLSTSWPANPNQSLDIYYELF